MVNMAVLVRCIDMGLDSNCRSGWDDQCTFCEINYYADSQEGWCLL